ncbi:hypothetical protein COZ55_00035 [archaeon CG_4_8_14_3_um_filter_38_5]|nr:MAG: hypothetical protein COS83_04700 [archaeon CG07_land_8_20_14_0_80_38_8]PIU89193.1 MAG: hypothetical protein COS64_01230 [archaeon CG06_land_8_20_14_3_00_37_11]PIX44809.1 MAG: hypothetical protein COZ55_00035 [archaeon CG_4_8_14_3_um_filter_38_5]
MKHFNKLFFPESEKLFVTLIISGMIFLTLTGFNAKFVLCDSLNGFCSFNVLGTGENYNLLSYLSVFLVFGVFPYFIACLIVEWFK